MSETNWQPSKAEYWKNLPSPARPWPSEVAYFEKHVVQKKAAGKMDVLILGATVELRSMCHKLGMDVHVVDFSKKFYKILSEQHMDYTGAEAFYEQDWRSMDLGKRFDLILGDWVPGVLNTTDYGQFYERVIAHLQPDGLFIARECLRPDSKPVDLDAVVKLHYERYAQQYSFYQTSMQCVYAYRPDPVTAMCDMASSRQGLDEVFKKGLMKQKDYDFFVRALTVEKSPLSVMVREDFERQIRQYFNIEATYYGAEPSATWYPIYALALK